MQVKLPALFVFSLIICQMASCQQPGSNDGPKQKKTLARYVGSTPCDEYIRIKLGISLADSCEKIQWNLTLFVDKISDSSGKYTLGFVSGIQASGSSGFAGAENKNETEGSWNIIRGTNLDPAAKLIQLNIDKSSAKLLLVQLSENVLHLLYEDRSLLMGDASWGYALNRIQK